MAEADVNPLHTRYIQLTSRFKASWTFHRFHDGLQKFFGRHDLEVSPFDFQSLYKRLKQASVLLNSGASAAVGEELAAVGAELDKVMASLEERDRKVEPSLLRLFFLKAKTYDERILIEMIRFYQEVQRGRSWEPDRLDKADFLVSRLAEGIAGPELEGDRPRLAKVVARLAENMAQAELDRQRVENRVKMIESVRAKMADIDSFEELTERDLVGHYRGLKHALGSLFFEASILPRVVDTNAALSALIRRLSRRAEEKIFTDYERISKLERSGQVEHPVLDKISQLHLQVGAFRKQMRAGNLRIADLAELRSTLAAVDAVLGEGRSAVAEPHVGLGEGTGRDLEFADLFTSSETRRLITPDLRKLVDGLAAGDPESEADEVAASEPLLSFRLDAREVHAYRRLASGADCDEQLEGFLLTAAALRRRLKQQADGLDAGSDESSGEDPRLSEDGQLALRLADWYLRQFSHFLESALLGDRPLESRDIQRCRMNLMRDYSGLWLAAHRPD